MSSKPGAGQLRRFSSASLFGRQLNFEELVGKYASLVPALEAPFNLVYSEMALIGILALSAGRIAIAQAVLEEVRFLTSTSVALVFVMRGIARFVVFGGVAVFAALYIVFIAMPGGPFSPINVSLLHLALNYDPIQMLKNFAAAAAGTSLGHVLLATMFGCLGSVVSLLMRLGEFETTKGRSREFLFLSGATLPIVGGIFAAVIASLLSSKILSSNLQVENVWLFVVVGFLSGFSERFTRNLLNMAEGRFPVPPREGAAGHR